jgi:hypothetical protein
VFTGVFVGHVAREKNNFVYAFITGLTTAFR